MCQGSFAFVLGVLSVIAAIFAFQLFGSNPNPCGPQVDCMKGHYCDCHRSTLERIQCSRLGSYFYPIDVSRDEYKYDVLERLTLLTQRNVKGQQHVVTAVAKALSFKLDNPLQPLVLHFAGDNGVGKTTLAQVISLALGFHCLDATCAVGDTTLVLSGVSYDGYSLQEFRKDVVRKIVDHANKFDKNGIVLINDLAALDPNFVRVLIPLFGRAAVFPEAPGTSLSHLTVIITTDFGRQGRTQGLSLLEMRRMIEDDFRALYSKLSSSMIQTYPLLPISLETAKEIVRMTVEQLRCVHRDAVKEIQISDDAVAWFIESVQDDLPVENGRIVANAVTAAVGPAIREHLLLKYDVPISLFVDIANDGSVTAVPTTATSALNSRTADT